MVHQRRTDGRLLENNVSITEDADLHQALMSYRVTLLSPTEPHVQTCHTFDSEMHSSLSRSGMASKRALRPALSRASAWQDMLFARALMSLVASE